MNMESAILPEFSRNTASEKLDIFKESNPINCQIESRIQETLYPLSSVDRAQSFIDFYASKHPTLFTDLSTLSIYMECRLVRQTDEAIDFKTETDVVIPKSFLKDAMFSQIDVYLNECLVTPGEKGSFDIQAAIKTILIDGFSTMNTSNRFDRILYDFDKLIKPEVDLRAVNTEAAAVPAVEAKWKVNEENRPFLQESHELVKGSKIFCVSGNILPPGLEDLKYLPNNISIRVRLHRSNPNYYLFQYNAPANNVCNHYLQIRQIYLYLDRLRLFQAPMISLERALLTNTATMGFRYIKPYTAIIPQNTTHFRQERIITEYIPHSLTVVLMKASTYMGHLNESQHVFAPHGLSSIKLLTEPGLELGKTSYDLYFQNDADLEKNWEAYTSLLKQMGKSKQSERLTLERFKTNACIFCFTLVPENPHQIPYSFPLRRGSTGLELTFSAATQHTLVALMFTTERNYLRIHGAEREISLLI